MKKTTCVIIGLGHIGQELARRLSRDLDIVCIEKDPTAAHEVERTSGGKVQVVVGDATSRLLLEDAGLESADVVVITFTTERLTLEIARILAEHFRVPRVLAIGITPSGIEALKAKGVETEGIFALSAAALRNRIEQRARAAHGIGLGKEEILEVEVHPRSRLVDKPLHELRPRRWHVAMVYRDGTMVMPRGDTVLRGRDRVVLTGDPGALRTVVDLLSFNFRLFPLEYGTGLTALLTGDEDRRYFEEVAYLEETFPVEGTGFVLTPPAQKQRSRLEETWGAFEPFQGVAVAAAEGSSVDAVLAALAHLGRRPGLIVLSRRWAIGKTFGGGRGLGRKGFLQALTERAACPVLLPGGTFPYQRAAVPGVAGVDLEHVLESVLEMVGSLGQESHVLLVQPSEHLTDDREMDLLEANTATVSDMALAYRTKVEPVKLKGNPVTEVRQALTGYDLTVLDTGGWKRQTWLGALLDPDIPWHLVCGAPNTTLLVPPEEEAL